MTTDVGEALYDAIRRLAADRILPAGLADRRLDGFFRLDDLGADSLGRIMMLQELEARFEVLIPEARVSQLVTLGDVEALLKELLEARSP